MHIPRMDEIYAANPTIVFREEFDDCLYLFDPDTGAKWALNGVGAFIWQQLNGRRTLKDIMGTVHEYYRNIPHNVEIDLCEFVALLRRKGFVIQDSVFTNRPHNPIQKTKVPIDSGPAPPRPMGTVGEKRLRVMKSPRSADISLTGRCNLRCAYCSHFSGAGDVSKDLPAAEWLKFFEELKRCAVMAVALQGGEPFCRNDIREIVDGIVRNRMRFTLLTNGTLIREETAAFLQDTGRCDGVQVSIDGSMPVTHDAFRGKGTFKRAVRGIRLLMKRKVPVSVRVTVHKRNVHELDAVARLLLEDLGLPGFSTNSAGYMGLCRQNTDIVQLSTEERSIAMAALKRLGEKYNGRISASAGPLAEARTWHRMIHAQKTGAEPNPNNGGYLSACGGPFESIAVRSDGVMVPCLQMSHIALGRTGRDDLLDVWQNHPELQRIRNRRTIPLSDFEFCRGCAYLPFCTGNCPALAYTLVGSDEHPSPDACLRRFLADGGRLPDGMA